MKKKTARSRSRSYASSAPAMSLGHAANMQCNCFTTPTQYVTLTVSLWALFSFALLISWSLFSNVVVLGTDRIPSLIAGVGVGFLLTLGAVATTTIVQKMAHHSQSHLKDLHLLWFSFAVTFALLWVITRYAVVFGVGIDGWYIAAFESIVLAVTHLLVAKSVASVC